MVVRLWVLGFDHLAPQYKTPSRPRGLRERKGTRAHILPPPGWSQSLGLPLGTGPGFWMWVGAREVPVPGSGRACRPPQQSSGFTALRERLHRAGKAREVLCQVLSAINTPGKCECHLLLLQRFPAHSEGENCMVPVTHWERVTGTWRRGLEDPQGPTQ